MALAVADQSSTLRVPRFRKQFFQTSFGPNIEYLAIPKLAGRIGEVAVPTEFDKSAKTIVFFNGWMLGISQWSMQMPAYTLPRMMPGFENYNLLFFNNLGHDKSEIGDASPSNYLWFCALAANELVRSLEVKRVFTAGHSMGGAISLEFASMFGGVDAMAFISPVLRNPLELFPLESIVTPLLPAIRAAVTGKASYEMISLLMKVITSDMFMAVWHADYRLLTGSKIARPQFSKLVQKSINIDPRIFLMAFDSMVRNCDKIGALLGDIHAPMKVLIGEKDIILSPDGERIILERLAPSAEVEMLGKATHWANSERPVTVNRRMSDFFSKFDGAGMHKWGHEAVGWVP